MTRRGDSTRSRVRRLIDAGTTGTVNEMAALMHSHRGTVYSALMSLRADKIAAHVATKDEEVWGALRHDVPVWGRWSDAPVAAPPADHAKVAVAARSALEAAWFTPSTVGA